MSAEVTIGIQVLNPISLVEGEVGYWYKCNLCLEKFFQPISGKSFYKCPYCSVPIALLKQSDYIGTGQKKLENDTLRNV